MASISNIAIKKKNKHTRNGRGTVPAAPSIETLLGILISYRDAYQAGHRGALCDQLNACVATIPKRPLEEMPLLPDGHRDGNPQPEDPVLVPYWAFEILQELAIETVMAGSDGRGRPTWRRRYKADLKHWHRYACVRAALDQKRGKWGATDGRDVFHLVASELAGTSVRRERIWNQTKL